MSKTRRCGILTGGNIGKKTSAFALVLLMILGALSLSLLTNNAQSLHSTTVSAGLIGDEKTLSTTGCDSSSFANNPPHNLEAPLSINKTFFTWWNANWHYRIPFNVTGTGNVSAPVNFTKNLTTLQMFDKAFENSTITIVRYHQNGSVADTITKYNFTQKISPQNIYNGTLTWQVPLPSIYYVYFDVMANGGNRTHTQPSNLTASGDARITSFGPPEGWWSELSPPLASYYTPKSQVNITVNTTANADSVTARFYRNGTLSFSRTFTTINHLRWINQTTFQQQGNWTVKINASDDAGYHTTMLSAGFWVGYPDLALTKLNVISTPYYRGKTLTVQAFVNCFNVTLPQVNVSLYISGNLVAHKNNLTFQKDHNTTVNFTWTPTTKGNVNLAVIVDPNNAIPESDEENNQLTMFLQIQGIPELGVVNITVPSQPVAEGDPATFYTCLTNKGDEDAINYRVNLYLEQTNTNHTSLTSPEKDFRYVNISMSQTVNISLVWGAVQYGGSAYNGKWVAGIRILSNDTKPDSDTWNNTFARYDRRLKVIPGDQTAPVITLVSVPQIQEQRTAALFLVTATDQSGIDTVTIAIKTPQNTYINSTMTPLANNRYQYILKNTSMLGKYAYSITATDLTFNKTKRTVKGGFTVVPDTTPPTIEYFDAYPLVQLVNKTIEFQCITSDSSGVLAVDVTITLPDSRTIVYHMINASNDTKYVYVGRFSHIGKYVYSITAEDTMLNTNKTDPATFWITRDLNDTDSDGMPDAWEIKYGFNPYDPSDANQDADHDGVTNLEEYKAGTNPLVKESSASDSLQLLKDNGSYILGLFIACVLIGGIVIYRLRRKKQ
jgi:hypothetical protein